MWKPDLCIYHSGCDDGFGGGHRNAAGFEIDAGSGGLEGP